MQGPVLLDSVQLQRMGYNKEDNNSEKENEVDLIMEAPHVPCTIKKGEFPPPLPSLARKSYSHLPHQVPWVLLQANRSNNRVVLHEVKSPQQMLFRPIRKQGRLVLNMLLHDSSDEEVEEDVGTGSTLSTASSADITSVVSSSVNSESNSSFHA